MVKMTRKLFVFGLIVVATSACATVRTPGGGTQRYFMYQVGVVVRVVNNCTPLLDLERVGGVVVKDLPYGESATVPLVSTPFSGNNRQMSLIAKGFTAGRKEYLGSASREFGVSTYEGSQEDVWEVNRITLPSGRGGCR